MKPPDCFYKQARVDLLQFLFVAYREFMTAFGTAASQNLAAIGSLHALAKAVNTFAAAVMGLEGAFHCAFVFA